MFLVRGFEEDVFGQDFDGGLIPHFARLVLNRSGPFSLNRDVKPFKVFP